MDEPSVKWEKSRYDEIRAGLMPFLIATGYTENDVTFVPISGLAGDNILTRVTKETCSWYDGPTLMEILDKLPVEKRDPNGPLRIPIIDKMKDANQIIAHGKIESGTLTVGDRIQLAPYGHPCQVGGILDAQNQVVRLAKPGENVQVRLLHIDDESLLNRGNVICARDAPMPVSQLMEVDLQVLDLLEYKPIMSKGYSCMMHMHTFADECYIKDLIYTEEKDPASGSMIKKEMPKFIKSQTVARVRLATNVPVPLEKFETIPQLGRFTLRDEGKTIAVGTILRYKPHATEAQKAVAKAVASATKQLEETKIAEGGDKNKELVFNMETGTTSEKVVLAGIEEGEEDDD